MKKAKLFKNGESQAVRLPKEFRFKGDDVYILRRGKAVILLPLEGFWDSLMRGASNFTKDYMNQRKQDDFEKRQKPFE